MNKTILIAGSRDFDDYYTLINELDNLTHEPSRRSGWQTISIISGGSKGADALAKKYAKESFMEFKEFPANWDLHGKAAGPIRNSEMLEYLKTKEYVEAFLFFKKGSGNRGTTNMMNQLHKANIKYTVIWVS